MAHTTRFRIRPLARGGFIVAGLGALSLLVTLIAASVAGSALSPAGTFYGVVGVILGFMLLAMAAFDRDAARARAQRKARWAR